MSWIKKTVQAPFLTVWWTSETLYGKNSDKKALRLVKDLLYNEQWLVCFPVSGCGFSDIFTRDNVISILAAEASANSNFSTGSGKQACDVMKYIWNAVTGKRASPSQFFTNPPHAGTLPFPSASETNTTALFGVFSVLCVGFFTRAEINIHDSVFWSVQALVEKGATKNIFPYKKQSAISRQT